MTLLTRHFTLRFVAPAFLGDAHQSGRWRTPPIKALLRQFWRMAWAAEHRFAQEDFDALRAAEGQLFGHAWLEDDRDRQGSKVAGRKSLVRLRLSRWEEGSLTSWDRLEPGKVAHQEVKRANYRIGPHAYLGFGPIDGRGGTHLRTGPTGKTNAAIQAGEEATLALAYPAEHAPLIDTALRLMHAYGTLGGRSRNGWGSFELSGQDAASQQMLESGAGALPLRPWTDALKLDWPHALGRDEAGPLIWATAPHADWQRLMKTLAEIKIALRTQFAFTTGRNAPRTEARHWLSYPVTNHSVQAWGQNLRLPNSLRFKLRSAPDGQLAGVIFHVPCQPPSAFGPDMQTLQHVWQQVHEHLDRAENRRLTRIPA